MHDLIVLWWASGATSSTSGNGVGVALVYSVGALATAALTVLVDRSHRRTPRTPRAEATQRRRIATLEAHNRYLREALIRHGDDPDEIIRNGRPL